VAGWGVVADVRKYIYEHMQRLSLRFYEDKQIGQLMSNVVNDTDLFEQLISHALKSERAERIAAMLRLAQSMEGISVAARDLDRDQHLLNVENGTIDLRTGDLLPHDRNRLVQIAPPLVDTWIWISSALPE
jgi:ABC-type multidrug transport system fused ATPase/permease subunit